MNASEIHHLSRWPEIKRQFRNWAEGTLLVFALVMLLGFINAQDEAVKARGELEKRKAVACPTELNGREFYFSGYEAVNLSRPGTAKLTCWYKGVK